MRPFRMAQLSWFFNPPWAQSVVGWFGSLRRCWSDVVGLRGFRKHQATMKQWDSLDEQWCFFFKTIFDKFFSGCEQLECKLYKKKHVNKKNTPKSRFSPIRVPGTVTNLPLQVPTEDYDEENTLVTEQPKPRCRRRWERGHGMSLPFLTKEGPFFLLQVGWIYMMVYCGVAIKPFLVFFLGGTVDIVTSQNLYLFNMGRKPMRF